MQKNISSCLYFLLILLLWSCSSGQGQYKVLSPNGRLSLEFSQRSDGNYVYCFGVDGIHLIDSSLMGYQTKTGELFPSQGWSVSDTKRNQYDGVWTPVWGKRQSVEDCYNELTLQLTSNDGRTNKSINIQLRAYDDGVAFRYVLPTGGETSMPETSIERERTQYNFAGDYTAWYYNGEHHNIGSEKLTDTDKRRQPVMTLKTPSSQYLALHEAHLQTGEPLVLASRKGETMFEVVSSPRKIQAGYESAWRVVFYGDTPGVMVDSHLLELLNPDPDPAMDFSWVKPGVATWDWRINGAKADGFVYGMNYASWVRMVDFASQQGMPYLVLDANWYGPEFEKDSDPLIGDKASDVKKLIAYGKEKGVGIWLYLNDVGGREYPIEATLKQYSDWGAVGVKYGFMAGDAVEKLARTQLITRLCAENRLLINYHDGPIHPYGQMRTWPNAVTREYCHAQLDAHRVFVPKTFVTTVFVNMLAGPIDMNNGMFDLRKGHTTRIDENQPVPSTLASEAARTAIVFSGATILPDVPEFYHKYPSLLRFISAQRMPWLESRTLSGEIGKHIVMMRETKDHYLIGAAIDEEGGVLTLPLDFLPEEGSEYSAELSSDTPESHYLDNREALEFKKITVRSKDSLQVYLAPGGGVCLLINKH